MHSLFQETLFQETGKFVCSMHSSHKQKICKNKLRITTNSTATKWHRNIISHGAITRQTISHLTVPPMSHGTMTTVHKSKKMVETTTIYEQRQELTSTNVAGKLHMM
jgi:hypothetical protein